jgi:hypothetical protein
VQLVDAEMIERWWRRWPDAGVAVRTGGASGLVVVDVDPRHGGAATVTGLAERFEAFPSTLTVTTGGGGWHWWFFAPGAGIPNAAGGRLGPGVDVRGDGGIVVAPPSRHASGVRYKLEADRALARLPAWVAELMTRPAPVSASLPAVMRAVTAGPGESRYGLAALDAEAAEVAATVPGGRNDRLVRAAFRAGQLAAGGELEPGRAEAVLVAAGVSAGLSAQEATATARSGLAAGAARPRSRPPTAAAPSGGRRGGGPMGQNDVTRALPDHLAVRPWPDPWREANGFGPHSAYVELVWSGRLGPTATLLYRRLGGLVRACPNGATVDVADLRAGLGLGNADSRWSPLARSVGRLVLFGAARWEDRTLEVRRALPPVPPTAVERLGPTAQRVHAAELARAARSEVPVDRHEPARSRTLE